MAVYGCVCVSGWLHVDNLSSIHSVTIPVVALVSDRVLSSVIQSLLSPAATVTPEDKHSIIVILCSKGHSESLWSCWMIVELLITLFTI